MDTLNVAVHNQWAHLGRNTVVKKVRDVCTFFSDDASCLKEFCHSLPPEAKVFVTGGSPCTELTTPETDKGALGATRPASSLFFQIHLTLFVLLRTLPPTHVRFPIKNAGSTHQRHCRMIARRLGIPDSVQATMFEWNVDLRLGNDTFSRIVS